MMNDIATNETNQVTPATNDTPATNAKTKRATKRAAKTKPATNAKRAAKTFTSVDLAREHNINPKTLRARIRRNIEKWEPLFHDNTRHVFADNATTRKRVEALLKT
jgi:hypothetical protein